MLRNAASSVRSVVKTIFGGGSGVKPGPRAGAGSGTRPGSRPEPGVEYGKPRSSQMKPAQSNQRLGQKQGSRPAQRPELKSSRTLIRTT